MSRIIAVLVVVALFACNSGGAAPGAARKPAPGEACATDGARVCLTPDQQAVCQGGQWRAFPCTGPDACATTGGTTTCDISGNKQDDACAAVDDDAVCASGGKERVRCVDGRIDRDPCRGPKGCAMEGDEARCDMSINLAGESCEHEGAASCTPDQKEYLECKNGQWISRYTCRGAKGCNVDTTADRVFCDQEVASIGDSCFPEWEGFWTCSVNGRAELVCKNGTWALSQKCHGSRGCYRDDKQQLWCR